MNNKSVLSIILVVAVLVFGVFLFKNKKQEPQIPSQTSDATHPPVTVIIPTSGQYCFSRIQKATETAPYNVEEHIVLNFSGVHVSGTKTGTQAGPDMTNGYTGTLSGAVLDDAGEMELMYAYTVEGSQNRELEPYTLLGDRLIKKRWVLIESKINNQSVLVPDYKGMPQEISYDKEVCK